MSKILCCCTKSRLLLFLSLFLICLFLFSTESLQAEETSSLPGFRGTIIDVEYTAPPVSIQSVKDTAPSNDIDLKLRARWALNYCINDVKPDQGYKATFMVDPLGCPEVTTEGEWDSGDMDGRLSWDFLFMRRMSGSNAGMEAQQGLFDRVFGYIGKDGHARVPSAGGWWGVPRGTPVIFTWTGSKALFLAAELYEETGDSEYLELGRRIIEGFRSLATFDSGRACLEGGFGIYHEESDTWGMNTESIMNDYAGFYHCLIEPLVRFAEATGDAQALELAVAFAEGIIQDSWPGVSEYYRIRPDGSFYGHVHAHTISIWGIAHLGVLLDDARYIEYARKVYDYVLSEGTDYGWFPEFLPHSVFGSNYRAETCISGDMVCMAALFAQAGFTEYWDDMERIARNHLGQAQWFVRPDYVDLYKEHHSDKPLEQVQTGLENVARYQGGFVAGLKPNDLAVRKNWIYMMGCCSCSGMRGIHAAWKHTITESDKGIFVNCSLNRDSELGRVISFQPEQGRLTVIAGKNRDFYLRPPAWVPRDRVAAYRDGKQMEVSWAGPSLAYVEFSSSEAGEELTIVYPLCKFTQKITIGDDPESLKRHGLPEEDWNRLHSEETRVCKEFEVSWKGNTVMSISPQGEVLPLFVESKRKAPAFPDEY